MEELLTAKQIQEALKVDRTTIYRMLKDGRLKGVKVGSQWRFHADMVEKILASGQNTHAEGDDPSTGILPWGYVQSVQDVFAEMSGIGAVITNRRGTPVTQISNSCDYCNLILRSKKGRLACQRSWHRLAEQPGEGPEFSVCQAGLQYARAKITVCGETEVFLVAGQFYAKEYDPKEREGRIEALAQEFGLELGQLRLAERRIRVLDQSYIKQISHWLSMVAKTFEQFGFERAEMLTRLHHIAKMSSIDFQHAGLRPVRKSELPAPGSDK
jgi:excisionase family DNA binding protein